MRGGNQAYHLLHKTPSFAEMNGGAVPPPSYGAAFQLIQQVGGELGRDKHNSTSERPLVHWSNHIRLLVHWSNHVRLLVHWSNHVRSCMFHVCFTCVSRVFHVCFTSDSCLFHVCFMSDSCLSEAAFLFFLAELSLSGENKRMNGIKTTLSAGRLSARFVSGIPAAQGEQCRSSRRDGKAVIGNKRCMKVRD